MVPHDGHGNCAEKSDIELVRAALSDPNRFFCLAKRYEAKLLRYVMAVTGFGTEDAEDVLQETMIRTYLNLNAFDVRLKFSSWIYRIAHNQAVSELRRRAVRPTVRIEDGDLERMAGGDDPLIVTERGLSAERIAKTLDAMDAKYREVLILRFLEGRDYSEISDILRKPISTVGNLISRGRKLFRAAHADHGASI